LFLVFFAFFPMGALQNTVSAAVLASNQKKSLFFKYLEFVFFLKPTTMGVTFLVSVVSYSPCKQSKPKKHFEKAKT